MGTPKSHKYLFDIPADLWLKANRKAHSHKLTLRAYLVDLVRKDLTVPNPSDLLPLIDLHAYKQKLHDASHAADELVKFLDDTSKKTA